MNSDLDIENESYQDYASVIGYARRTKVIRLRPNHFDIWGDAEFYNRFRMSKQTAKMVLNQIASRIENKTNR